MMFLRFLLLWTPPSSLPRRPLLPRISLLLLELLLMSRRLLIPRRSVPVRVRPVAVSTPSVVVLLLSTRTTMVLSKPSVTCPELSFAALTDSTSSNLLLVDTWDVSASGPRLLLMPLTRSTDLRVRRSPRTSWLTLIWPVSSTPMKSNLSSTPPSVLTRSTFARRTLLRTSRLLPSLIRMPLLLARVSNVLKLLVRTRRLLS
mmetsp:Transcript_10393/g.15796  ORF Transcript_10393/g.15796 Transcript_10393/m.15796 type:complete len:202 (-) Transcript_10393:160-765(-)